MKAGEQPNHNRQILPHVDSFKPGDRFVLRTWERKPIRGKRRLARTNYSFSPKEVIKMQTEPMTVLDTNDKIYDTVMMNINEYLGKNRENPMHWFHASDLDKVDKEGNVIAK